MPTETTTPAAIFERMIFSKGSSPSAEVAASLLTLDFSPQDLQRMEELAEKARQGTLAVDEQQEIVDYERVGHYLAILQSKARRAHLSSG